jgi:hypothetical protein
MYIFFLKVEEKSRGCVEYSAPSALMVIPNEILKAGMQILF